MSGVLFFALVVPGLLLASLCLLCFDDLASYKPWQRRLADVAAVLLGGGGTLFLLRLLEGDAVDLWYVAVPTILAGAALGTAFWKTALWMHGKRTRSAENAELVSSPGQILLFRRLCLAMLPTACALHIYGYVRLGRPGGSGSFFATFALLMLYWLFASGIVASGSDRRWPRMERALRYYAQVCLCVGLAAMVARAWPSFERRYALAARSHAIWLLGLTSILILESFKGLAWTQGKVVSRRQQCRPVLEAEVKRWSSMPWEQLVSALADEQHYEVAIASTTYQVEATLLENTGGYVHVLVSADDGSFWAACSPLSEGFVVEKHSTPPPPPR